LHDYLADHGITSGLHNPGNRVLVPGFRRRSDRESRLRYLESTVRPVVEWLLTNTDEQEIRRRLGLPNDSDHDGTSVDCPDGPDMGH
jgi:hypothetical protein